MNRARIVIGEAAFFATCLIGCSGSSEGPQPVIVSLELEPPQSNIKVADKVTMYVVAKSDQGTLIDGYGCSPSAHRIP
jgi:hypothetical protein